MPGLTVTSWLLTVGVLARLLSGWQRARGTTLRAPLAWAMWAVILLAVLASRKSANWSGAWQFAVVAGTFCPVMAVLGAKRPQDRGWQWVVATLWLVLAWPAAQAIALDSGPTFELFAAGKLFIVGLLAVGLLNYLPTCHWPATLVVTCGQMLLLSEPLGWSERTGWHLPAALGSFFAAALLVGLRRTPSSNPNDACWLRFRDSYGAFWALRIRQRVNDTAALRDWPVRLHWTGFTPTARDQTGELTPAQEGEVQQTLDTLLRRFF